MSSSISSCTDFTISVIGPKIMNTGGHLWYFYCHSCGASYGVSPRIMKCHAQEENSKGMTNNWDRQWLHLWLVLPGANYNRCETIVNVVAMPVKVTCQGWHCFSNLLDGEKNLTNSYCAEKGNSQPGGKSTEFQIRTKNIPYPTEFSEQSSKNPDRAQNYMS